MWVVTRRIKVGDGRGTSGTFFPVTLGSIFRNSPKHLSRLYLEAHTHTHFHQSSSYRKPRVC